MTYQLLARTTHGVVVIETFPDRLGCQNEYRRRMRLLARGDQSDEVLDFAIGTTHERRERPAGDDRLYEHFTQGQLNL